MSIISTIGKFISSIIFTLCIYTLIVHVFIPNRPIIELVMEEFTESVFGVEPSPSWEASHNNQHQVKKGIFIQPYIFGVKGPVKWISSPDSLHPKLQSDLKYYDASF